MNSSIKDFSSKLSNKISLLIISVETVALFSLGFFYVQRFDDQLNVSLKKNFETPAFLLSNGMLNYESVEDSIVLATLVGEMVSDCKIIGTNGKIYYSLSLEDKNKDVATIENLIV